MAFLGTSNAVTWLLNQELKVDWCQWLHKHTIIVIPAFSYSHLVTIFFNKAYDNSKVGTGSPSHLCQ